MRQPSHCFTAKAQRAQSIAPSRLNHGGTETQGHRTIAPSQAQRRKDAKESRRHRNEPTQRSKIHLRERANCGARVSRAGERRGPANPQRPPAGGTPAPQWSSARIGDLASKPTASRLRDCDAATASRPLRSLRFKPATLRCLCVRCLRVSVPLWFTCDVAMAQINCDGAMTSCAMPSCLRAFVVATSATFATVATLRWTADP